MENTKYLNTLSFKLCFCATIDFFSGYREWIKNVFFIVPDIQEMYPNINEVEKTLSLREKVHSIFKGNRVIVLEWYDTFVSRKNQ